jgi:hypothetical protein
MEFTRKLEDDQIDAVVEGSGPNVASSHAAGSTTASQYRALSRESAKIKTQGALSECSPLLGHSATDDKEEQGGTIIGIRKSAIGFFVFVYLRFNSFSSDNISIVLPQFVVSISHIGQSFILFLLTIYFSPGCLSRCAHLQDGRNRTTGERRGRWKRR